jgi:L-fuconolactonase
MSVSDRRTFLKQAAGASLVLLPGALPAQAKKPHRKGKPMSKPDAEHAPIPIVDTHQHLWDLDRFRLLWLQGAGKLNRSFVMSDYFEATEGLNVVKTVYMEVDVEPAQHVQEAEYVIDLCRRDDNPMAGAVIGGRPASPEFGEYVRRFSASPYVKGVRQVLHGGTPPGYCLTPEFVRGIRQLGEAGLRFDICLRSAELADGAKLADACPDTRFILDHCGNANVQAEDRSQWERDLAEVAQRKNVVCKVSGIVASAKPDAWKPADLEPIVKHVLNEFGPDRVVFGGDWPVCTLASSYRDWVGALRWIVRDMPVRDQRKLFHDNSVRFYELG